MKTDGFVLDRAPAGTADALAAAYDAWTGFFASEEKLAWPGSQRSSYGYHSFVAPYGREPHESFYWSPGAPLPLSTVAATEALYSVLAVAVRYWTQVAEELGVVQHRAWRTCLRIVRYPALDGARESSWVRPLVEARGVRLEPHVDPSILTILPAATSDGLELFARGGWLPLVPTANELLVHAGRTLEEATEGRVPAISHRVAMPSSHHASRDRLASVLFVT